MIVVAMTDIHGNLGRLNAIASDIAAADLVLLTGDLTHFGHREAAEDVVSAVRRYNQHLLAVPGNCDYAEVAAYLTEQGINLHARHVINNGIAFVGVGGSLPAPRPTPNEYDEEEIEAFLAQAVTDLPANTPLVLVTHQPPYDTVADLASIGRHVGSRAIRRFIGTHQPLVCFTGHIHEGRGMDTIGSTRIVNPGPLRYGGYAYAKIESGQAAIELRG
ncbi:MAG: hypothetical protein GX552_13025 [Chloroflexi bacterium]|jgi:Icc-related predicted phosphoesterase|nr:hypothetical protein [Chloroflexota bacterium]